jgi:hypothetical protein
MGLRTTLLVAGLLAMTVGRSSHAQAPAASPASPPPIAIGGVLYTQYQYSLRSDSAGNHANNFDVARVYLTATARLAKGVGGRLTLESFRPTSTSGIETRVKYAFAQFTPEKSRVTFKVGQLQTPYVEFDERLWDYRAQGTVAMDRNGYLSSTDLGLSTEGSWREEGINFSAGVFNGETFRSAPGDHHKDAAARVSVRLLRSDDMSQVGGLRVTGFALEGQPTRGGTRRRWLGQLSYRSTRAMIAGQLGGARDRVDSTLTAPTTSARVASVYGWVRFGPAPFAILGRVDVVDPSTDVGDDRRTRIIAGVSYRISQNLRLLADVDHLSYQGGAPTSALDASRSQALFQVDFVF